ncbi:unnamed protein product [Aureobasidium uvarum]|uniref:Uncharacterized protein n=1 Tax=Aureobasidium uvarum TaxID=2773716 RepID=A0A9N8KC24_9PEZI|nr:unnamed protein product [Aureobasidium uvarum]
MSSPETTRPNNNDEFGLTTQQDKILALTTLISTISLATLDTKAGSQMLGGGKSALANALPHRIDVSLPKTPILVESVSRSYVRGATACAFFYLAYKDFRAAQLRQKRLEDEDVSVWRWKYWAACGAAGVLAQSLGPLPGGVWEKIHKPNGNVKGQAQRLGVMTLAKGGILMATVPFCLSAWRSL